MNAKEFFIEQDKEAKFVETEVDGQKVAIRQVSYCELQKLISGSMDEKQSLAGVLGNVCDVEKKEPLFTPADIEKYKISQTTVQKLSKAFFDANTILGGIEEAEKK